MNLKPFYICILLCLQGYVSAAGQNIESEAMVSALLLENSTMTISGSSTLHDWTVEATKFSVQFRVPESWFDSHDSWAGENIALLSVTVPVEHLDGGKNKMNRDLREALRSGDFPEIEFTWNRVAFSDSTDLGRQADVSGSLRIAGEEREIQFSADLRINEQSQIVAAGCVPINMRDYNIDPPRAMLGLIRTDENIELMFELHFEEES